MNGNFGNMLKGRITQVYGSQEDFINSMNASLVKRGQKPTVSKANVSSWCKLTSEMMDVISEVLDTDCRNFFA